MCPTDCPVGRWQYGCEKSCENCEQDCDKFNGNCTTCRPGFTDAASGCSQSCPQFTFGARCSGNCITKCMTECVDKISGACPPTPANNMVYLWWLVLLLPIVLVIVYLLRKQSDIAAIAEGEM
ncbi:scavenger receptor class F member 1-like [Physella acuta]|uniref:scavenger receptor class F member 1-like n=1 Tax=Physella acuta TaxID=109671 RepID=UPI0027DB105A|nr:scavenger receptor class F member 1-like [Physella acuta]